MTEGEKFSLKKAAYDILRPEISSDLLEHKRSNLIETGSIGTVSSAGLYGISRLMEWRINYFNSGMSPFPENIGHYLLSGVVGHPLEVLLAGAAIGFGIRAYPMLFHRPLPPEDFSMLTKS